MNCVHSVCTKFFNHAYFWLQFHPFCVNEAAYIRFSVKKWTISLLYYVVVWSVCGGTMQTSPRFIAHYYIVTGHKIVPIVCTIKHVYRASLLRWLAHLVLHCTDKAQFGRNGCLQLHSGHLIWKFHVYCALTTHVHPLSLLIYCQLPSL